MFLSVLLEARLTISIHLWTHPRIATTCKLLEPIRRRTVYCVSYRPNSMAEDLDLVIRLHRDLGEEG